MKTSNLLRCPHCGKDVSDNAAACPNCGCLLRRKVDKEVWQQAVKEKEDNDKEAIGCFFFWVILIGILIWLLEIGVIK